MNPALGHELQAQIKARLEELGFHEEISRKRIWAARSASYPLRLLGWQTLFYCLTCIMDEERHVVRLWDAVVEKRRGLLLRSWRPAEATGYRAVREELERLAHEQAWGFEYRPGHTALTPPRVFREK
jgi:hypothetical protein